MKQNSNPSSNRALWNILFLVYPLIGLLFVYLFSPDTETIRKSSQPIWILGAGLIALFVLWLIYSLIYISPKHAPFWMIRILSLILAAGIVTLWGFVITGSLRSQTWLMNLIEYKVYFKDLFCFGALSLCILTQTAALVMITSIAGHMKKKISKIQSTYALQSPDDSLSASPRTELKADRKKKGQ